MHLLTKNVISLVLHFLRPNFRQSKLADYLEPPLLHHWGTPRLGNDTRDLFYFLPSKRSACWARIQQEYSGQIGPECGLQCSSGAQEPECTPAGVLMSFKSRSGAGFRYVMSISNKKN